VPGINSSRANQGGNGCRTSFGLENKNGNPENESLGVNAGLSGCMTHDFSGQSERRWPVAYADPRVGKYRVEVGGNHCKTRRLLYRNTIGIADRAYFLGY
jgi:hypothetical protein